MPMVRAMRMLNAIEAGALSGAQLETLITTDPGRLAELNVLLGMRGQARRLAASDNATKALWESPTALTRALIVPVAHAALTADEEAFTRTALTANMTAVAASSTARAAIIASPTATAAVEASPNGLVAWVTVPAGLTPTAYANMTAVIASSTAMAAVAASSTAMAAVAASSTAMAAVIASSTAMAAVIASSTAKMAVFNSDTALDAIAASETALGSMRAAAQYAVLASNSNPGNEGRTLAGTVPTASYIVLGVSTSDGSTGSTMTVATLRPGSTRQNTNVTAAGNVSLATALGPLVMPMVSPFTIVSTDGGTQIGYVGALRCDV